MNEDVTAAAHGASPIGSADVVKHTPTPWKIGFGYGSIYAGEMRVVDIHGWGFLTGKGAGAAGLSLAEASAIQRANARLIVTAVNQHDALLKCAEALRGILAVLKEDAPNIDFPKARAALTALEQSNGKG